MTTTLLVFIFYGARMSPVILKTASPTVCEQTFGKIKDKLLFSGGVGRLDHLCLEGIAPDRSKD